MEGMTRGKEENGEERGKEGSWGIAPWFKLVVGGIDAPDVVQHH